MVSSLQVLNSWTLLKNKMTVKPFDFLMLF